MKLNRRSKRMYYRSTEEGKRLLKLNFLHPDKVENRMSNISSGREAHENFIQHIQEGIVERNSEEESRIMDILKEKGLSKNEIDEYMDLWSALKLWPKPEDHIQIRKEFKKLKRKYRVYA